MLNTNPVTGIRYGVIAGNSLDPEVLNDLFYGPGAVDRSYEAAREEAKREYIAEWEACNEQAHIAASETDGNMSERDREDFIVRYLNEHGFEEDAEEHAECKLDRYEFSIDEPSIEGAYEGVKYAVSWLGGAPLVWVFEGPVGYVRSLCSPCVPGAVDCDSGFTLTDDGGYEGYVVPQSWLADTQ